MVQKIGICNEKKKKARNYAFTLYEDSASAVWKSMVSDLHVKSFWICHDMDTHEDGSLKKLHYHVMLMFPNAISWKSAEELFGRLGIANGCYEVVNSVSGYARYLCHMDNPEKYQYGLDNVHEFGGANYQEIIRKTKSNKYDTLREILDFCDNNGVECYARVVRYGMENNEKWLDTLLDIRYGKLIQDYIKSVYWSRH